MSSMMQSNEFMKRALIIDDEPDITEIVTIFSKHLGYLSDVSHSGDDAISKLINNPYWAIFCDFKMPGCNGIEMFHKIRELNPSLSRRFVLVTGAILDRKTNDFVKEKDIVVLRKPFTFNALKEVFSILEEIK
jgi:response regulator RpfG family c-di-GMP phosphodiesterase